VHPAHPQNSAAVPALVLVTGPPGSGKSTIATALRAQLAFPLISKDGLKEVLGDALAVQGRLESEPLGAATFDVLAHVVHELLENGVSVIAEGNFTAASALLRDLPPARIVQVHVSAEPALLRARMLDRAAGRHPVHWDGEAADEVAERAAADEWQPLPLDGDLLEIDTTSWPDVDDVTRNVVARLGAPGSR
jgi:predicted kinase